jgi:hypothetical protein
MNTSKSRSVQVAPFAGVHVRQFSKAKTIAEKLGVCPRTIFRWADDGRIARHKINARVVLFDEAEVLALIESARISHVHCMPAASSGVDQLP